MSEITYAIAAEEEKCPGIFGQKGVYGLGYGLFCTSFALGGSIGSLMSGFVMAGAGWGTLTWALAVWTAGGAVVVGLAVGSDPAPRTRETADEEVVVSGIQGGERGVADMEGRSQEGRGVESGAVSPSSS